MSARRPPTSAQRSSEHLTVGGTLMHTAAAIKPSRTSRRPWVLGRRYLLRVPGLPYDVTRSLRFPDTVAWADRVLREQEQLAVAGRGISDRLYHAVAAIEDEADRRQL